MVSQRHAGRAIESLSTESRISPRSILAGPNPGEATYRGREENKKLSCLARRKKNILCETAHTLNKTQLVTLTIPISIFVATKSVCKLKINLFI